MQERTETRRYENQKSTLKRKELGVAHKSRHLAGTALLTASLCILRALLCPGAFLPVALWHHSDVRRHPCLARRALGARVHVGRCRYVMHSALSTPAPPHPVPLVAHPPGHLGCSFLQTPTVVRSSALIVLGILLSIISFVGMVGFVRESRFFMFVVRGGHATLSASSSPAQRLTHCTVLRTHAAAVAAGKNSTWSLCSCSPSSSSAWRSPRLSMPRRCARHTSTAARAAPRSRPTPVHPVPASLTPTPRPFP